MQLPAPGVITFLAVHGEGWKVVCTNLAMEAPRRCVNPVNAAALSAITVAATAANCHSWEGWLAYKKSYMWHEEWQEELHVARRVTCVTCVLHTNSVVDALSRCKQVAMSLKQHHWLDGWEWSVSACCFLTCWLNISGDNCQAELKGELSGTATLDCCFVYWRCTSCMSHCMAHHIIDCITNPKTGCARGWSHMRGCMGPWMSITRLHDLLPTSVLLAHCELRGW